MRSTLDSLRDTLKSWKFLQAHLVRARASGAVFAKSVARPPWGLRLPGTIQLTVHAVIQGRMWLWHDDPRTRDRLTPGQAALVRGGRDHFIAHRPNARCLSPEQFQACTWTTKETWKPATMCSFAAPTSSQATLAADYSKLFHRCWHCRQPQTDPFKASSACCHPSSPARELGQQTVLDRLLDILLVLAIRASFQQGEHAPRWYQASVDSRLAPALNVMHGDAAHVWTVPELAAISGLSRAAFARAFQLALGQAPMQYLTEWRMTLARDHLRASELTLTEIGTRTGYGSPYAFAAAFRRHHGLPPGQWRQREMINRVSAQTAVDRVHAT